MDDHPYVFGSWNEAPRARRPLSHHLLSIALLVATALVVTDPWRSVTVGQEIAVPATPIESWKPPAQAGTPLHRFKPLASIQTQLLPAAGPVPADAAPELFPRVPRESSGVAHDRGWERVELQWEPAGYAHYPLYFEDYELERFGNSRRQRVQPWLSGAHFFGRAWTLPLRVVHTRPRSCVLDIDPCRPMSAGAEP